MSELSFADEVALGVPLAALYVEDGGVLLLGRMTQMVVQGVQSLQHLQV